MTAATIGSGGLVACGDAANADGAGVSICTLSPRPLAEVGPPGSIWLSLKTDGTKCRRWEARSALAGTGATAGRARAVPHAGARIADCMAAI